MVELMLINVSGRDRPGLTVALCEALARHDVQVLDMGQAVIHDELAWGLMVEVPSAASSGPVYKDVLVAAHSLGLEVRFTPVTEAEYAEWVMGQGAPRHVVTLLGRQLSAAHVAAIARVVARYEGNIVSIERLSGRLDLAQSMSERRSAIEFTIRGAKFDLESMREEILMITQSLEVDVAIQSDDLHRRNRRLVCFDMDSTLIPVEVIDELAVAAGVGEEVAAITAAAMAGELNFNDSFARRLGALKGLREEALEQIEASINFTEGAERLIQVLKMLGYQVAILSGGFRWFAERLGARLGADYVYANELEIVDGVVTGRVTGAIVDGARKAELLRDIARLEGISLSQTIAIGDGANDLPMLRIAGLGVAFHAKPAVRREARHSIATHGLDGLLYLMGVRAHEVEKHRDESQMC